MTAEYETAMEHDNERDTDVVRIQNHARISQGRDEVYVPRDEVERVVKELVSALPNEDTDRPRKHNFEGDRLCTECGTNVEDEPYEFWLFFTCRECAKKGNDDE